MCFGARRRNRYSYGMPPAYSEIPVPVQAPMPVHRYIFLSFFFASIPYLLVSSPFFSHFPLYSPLLPPNPFSRIPLQE